MCSRLFGTRQARVAQGLKSRMAGLGGTAAVTVPAGLRTKRMGTPAGAAAGLEESMQLDKALPPVVDRVLRYAAEFVQPVAAAATATRDQRGGERPPCPCLHPHRCLFAVVIPA